MTGIDLDIGAENWELSGNISNKYTILLGFLSRLLEKTGYLKFL